MKEYLIRGKNITEVLDNFNHLAYQLDLDGYIRYTNFISASFNFLIKQYTYCLVEVRTSARSLNIGEDSNVACSVYVVKNFLFE